MWPKNTEPRYSQKIFNCRLKTFLSYQPTKVCFRKIESDVHTQFELSCQWHYWASLILDARVWGDYHLGSSRLENKDKRKEVEKEPRFQSILVEMILVRSDSKSWDKRICCEETNQGPFSQYKFPSWLHSCHNFSPFQTNAKLLRKWMKCKITSYLWNIILTCFDSYFCSICYSFSKNNRCSL